MLRNFSSYYIGSKPTNQISHAFLPNDLHGKNIPRRFFLETRDRDGGVCVAKTPLYGLFASYNPLFYIFIY